MLDIATALPLVRGRKWHHDWEIIPGLRTEGTQDPRPLLDKLDLPLDLAGGGRPVRLADVGASNGYFSLEARRRGATVVAFDFRHKDNSNFALAQHITGVHDIEHHHVNVLAIRPAVYGTFDIVLALGLLYHVSDPYHALANCAALSHGKLYVESYCIDRQVPKGLASEPIMRFIPDPLRFPGQKQPNTERTNFWGFTSTCLKLMVEDLGFEVENVDVSAPIRVLISAKRVLPLSSGKTRRRIAYGMHPHIPVQGDLNSPASWTTL